MMSWGEQLRGVTVAMNTASGGSRWAKERHSRELKKVKITHTPDVEPIEQMMAHLNEWHKGNNDLLFQEDYVFDHGYRPTEHHMRNYMMVLRSYACTQRVADKLLSLETRTAISYSGRKRADHTEGKSFSTNERVISENTMAESQLYIFRFPRVVQQKAASNASVEDTGIAFKEIDTTDEDNEEDDKYMLMLVLPSTTPVSAVRLFEALKDITPVACVLPSHFGIMIKKCGSWRSMQTTPVDNFGQWKHIGMGKQASQNPFMLRCNLGQASTQGVEPADPTTLTGKPRRFHK